jgi:hypothetical protein
MAQSVLLWAGWLGLIPSRGVNLHSTACRMALGPTQPPIQWALGALSLGTEWPRHEGDISPPSVAEVKNIGAISPLPSPMTTLPFRITSQTALRVTLKLVW